MRHVLITGAAGFIGSHTVDCLIHCGYRVTGVDNLSKGSIDNIYSARQSIRFRFIRGDITNPSIIKHLRGQYDVIMHFAASKIPRYGGRLETILNDVDGVKICLEIARRRKSRFIFISTSDVYGKNPKIPFSEKSDYLLGRSASARWSYAVSKLLGEHLCFAYAESFQVPIIILRYFGVYGPREYRGWWGGPQSAFIENLLDGKKIVIHGDGRQTRCLTYVEDIVRGTVSSLKLPLGDVEIFNLGSKEEITMFALAERICREFGKNPKKHITFLPYSKLPSRDYEDVRRKVPDLHKAKKQLGYDPRVRLADGVARTVAWHIEQRRRK